MLARAIQLAGVTPADLSAVVLAGGSSRIPLVAEMVSVGARPSRRRRRPSQERRRPRRGAPRRRDGALHRRPGTGTGAVGGADRASATAARADTDRSNSPLRPSPRRSTLGRSRRSRRGRPARRPSASRRSGRPPGAGESSSRSPRRSCSSPQASARSCSSAAVATTAVHRRTPRSRQATRPSSRTPPTRPAPRKRRTRTHRRNPTSRRRPSQPVHRCTSEHGRCVFIDSIEPRGRHDRRCATRPSATNRNWTPGFEQRTCTSTSTRCRWTRPASRAGPATGSPTTPTSNGEEIYRFAASTIPAGATKLCASVANVNHGLDDHRPGLRGAPVTPRPLTATQVVDGRC